MIFHTEANFEPSINFIPFPSNGRTQRLLRMAQKLMNNANELRMSTNVKIKPIILS